MIYFTADWHGDHNNIIKYCNRPYKNINDMRESFIGKFNNKVTEYDTTYHIGDFMMTDESKMIRKVIKELNGTHILILGNHDKLKPFTYIDIGFQSVHTSLVLNFIGRFCLVHDPSTYCAIPDNMYMLHGHIHTLYKTLLPNKNVINVGVDVWDYEPVELSQIYNLIIEKERRIDFEQ